jgi:hypothetical protein
MSDAADRVIAMVDRLEDLPNTNDLMQALNRSSAKPTL